MSNRAFPSDPSFQEFEGLRVRVAEELQSRQRKNSSYSMRAFARWLGINVTSLSEFLSRKRVLSSKNLLRVLNRLEGGSDGVSNRISL